MSAPDSWRVCVAWFDAYASDPAYNWASFFPHLLRRLEARQSAAGLYAHRWATTLVVSRFGVHPDWQLGPKVELLALPGGRVEVSVHEAYNRRVEQFTLNDPVDVAAFDRLFAFAAGES